MRGKALRGFQVHVDAGITPACAGKSFRPIWGVEKTPDHPRMCGEKNTKKKSGNKATGSPPHVRGKVFCDFIADGVIGITPACAGKSRTLQAIFRFCWDHPRMCGEKDYIIRLPNFQGGSPPHVRGKGVANKTTRRMPRITPACAGKSSLVFPSHTLVRDHPRMCGEKRLPDETEPCKRGSPPHVRGKVVSCDNAVLLFGITPACAGKSTSNQAAHCSKKDHPRMCGEKQGMPSRLHSA